MSQSIDIEQNVRAYIIDTILFGDDVTLESNTSFQEQGIIDSMGFLDLITFLAKEYNVEIKDEELLPENFDSLRRVAEFIKRKQEQDNSV